jgi:uncharacterized damage-inducible protein DinB
MDLRYPIGRFDFSQTVSSDARPGLIDDIRLAPELLRRAVEGLDHERLETPYRPDGWTIRQVVHHLPDSHINCYVRFRLALTEDEPKIKGYDEKKWAELPDARNAPVALSLALLEHLHERWVRLMTALTEDDWARTFHHSEMGLRRLDVTLALYAWHGKHHTAQITHLRERMGW